jgi:hypothetical protein
MKKKDLSWDETGVNLTEIKRQKKEQRQLKNLRKKKKGYNERDFRGAVR